MAGLSYKLQDLATLLRDYLDWLAAHKLEDADQLLDFATSILRANHAALKFGGLWMDGFTVFSAQELDLLAELTPCFADATLTFCLDQVPTEDVSWLSNWAVVRRTYLKSRDRLAGLPNCEVAPSCWGVIRRKAGSGATRCCVTWSGIGQSRERLLSLLTGKLGRERVSPRTRTLNP